jgi:methyl-accepting chemotaxis protein
MNLQLRMIALTLGSSAATAVVLLGTGRANGPLANAIVWSVVLVALSGGAGFLAARRWLAPFQRLIDGLESIAGSRGGLSRRLDPGRHTLLWPIAERFNTFLDRLQESMAGMADNASEVSNSSASLSTSANLVAQGTGLITGQSAAVASSAEALTNTMTSAAASTQQMSDNVKMIASAVEEMTASIEEVAKNAEQAAGAADTTQKMVGQSNTRVGELAEAAGEIGKVVEVIQEIAEQTNLLALNATIEASRAGDAGKGFAVVATEVKELAQQTATATDDIRQRILRIQETTNEAVTSIADIGAAIANVNSVSRTIASAVEEQTITTKEIARNIAQSSAALESVADGVSGSANTSTEIAQNIASVDEAIRSAADGVSQTQDASGKLIRIAEQLQEQIDRFDSSTDHFRAAHLKALHNLWVVKLTELLSGKLSLSASDVTSPKECKFGRWYQNAGLKRFGQLDAYRVLGRHHEAIHQAAREVVALYNNGEAEKAAERLDELRETSRELGGILDQLEQVAESEPAPV